MVAGFWTLDRTTITGQSAFILRHHTAAVSSYDCTFDDLELVHQSLRTLEPPYTHKFPRVNAQDSKLGPIQPWDVKDFLRAEPRASLAPQRTPLGRGWEPTTIVAENAPLCITARLAPNVSVGSFSSDSTRSRRSRHVRFAPIASEPSHRSEFRRGVPQGEREARGSHERFFCRGWRDGFHREKCNHYKRILVSSVLKSPRLRSVIVRWSTLFRPRLGA